MQLSQIFTRVLREKERDAHHSTSTYGSFCIDWTIVSQRCFPQRSVNEEVPVCQKCCQQRKSKQSTQSAKCECSITHEREIQHVAYAKLCKVFCLGAECKHEVMGTLFHPKPLSSCWIRSHVGPVFLNHCVSGIHFPYIGNGLVQHTRFANCLQLRVTRHCTLLCWLYEHTITLRHMQGSSCVSQTLRAATGDKPRHSTAALESVHKVHSGKRALRRAACDLPIVIRPFCYCGRWAYDLVSPCIFASVFVNWRRSGQAMFILNYGLAVGNTVDAPVRVWNVTSYYPRCTSIPSAE